jgi:putative alpha-1,2-mannosidase
MFLQNQKKIKRVLAAVVLAAVLSAVQLVAAQKLSLTPFVDPFIGTDPNPFSKVGYSFDTGNVFPGAVCPRGMLAWSPDTTHQDKIAGGYWYPDSAIEDFSLTHFSGRGVPCLKDIPFMPVMGQIDTSPGTNWSRFAATFSHKRMGRPGLLSRQIRQRNRNGIDRDAAHGFRTIHFSGSLGGDAAYSRGQFHFNRQQ